MTDINLDLQHLQKGKSTLNPKRDVQTYINWFVFFLAFPAINLLGNSITFYIFIAIILKVGVFWNKSFHPKFLFGGFLFIILVSSFLTPFSMMPRHPGIIHTLQFIIQYIYWILVAIFFITYYKKIDFLEVSKWVFYAVLLSILGFYILPFSFDVGVAQVTSTISRNSFVFDLLCGVPISFVYINSKYRKEYLKYFLSFFLLVFLFTNGRSGAIIGMLELVLIMIILFPYWLKYLRLLAFPLIIIFIMIQGSETLIYLDVLANRMEVVSPRFASLLRGEGEGDLKEDKSWLHRELMVDKGIEIVKEYPIFGIGPNNFIYYDGELNSYYNYTRLNNLPLQYYNSRSAHNSYVQIMSETGIFGLIFISIILFLPIYLLLKSILLGNVQVLLLPLVSLLGISMHFYAISALTGAIPWFVIGISFGVVSLKSRKSKNDFRVSLSR